MDNTSSTTQDEGSTVELKQATLKPVAGKKAKSRKRKLPGLVKWLIAIVIIGGIAGGVYYWRTQTATAGAITTTVTMPVIQGDLNISVESNGNVQASREEAVSYESAGDVIAVLVKPGDKVTAGQTLVQQNDDAEKQAVTQAQAALNTAQAKLDDLKKGPTEADVASAQADVQSAQADLDKVKAGATAKDIADAQAELRSAEADIAAVKSGATPKEIADAEADLKTAQAAYDTIKAGATAKDIKDAEADLKTAQAKYDALNEPPTASDVKEAQSKLDAAKASLAALKAGPKSTELSAARLKVSQAESSLKGIQTTAALNKSEKELALAKAGRDLEVAQRAYGAVADELLNENGDLVVDSSDPRYNQYWTAFNTLKDAEAAVTQAQAELDNVRQSEIDDVADAQAQIDDANTQLTELQKGATAEELAAAQLDVDTAQNALDTLTKGPSKEDLASAEADVTKAQNALDDLKAGPTAEDLAKAEADVTKAQTALDELKAGPTADTLATAQTNVDKARNALADLQKGPTADEIASSEAALAKSKASLAALYEPATASEIAAAEETVASAQKDLDDAKSDLTKVTLTAPFSGIVASVTAEAGGKASVGGEAVTIYDEGGMHLELAVNETDIQKIQVGQPVKITLDALPSDVLTGTVSTVSYTSSTNQDVVTYQVVVSFDPLALPIKTGMSATASITVESHAGVIEVPTRAIKSQGNRKTIEVLYGDTKEPVTVSVLTGATDGTFTEITSCVDTNGQCLRAGDTLSVTTTTSTSTNTTTQQGFPGGAQFGGGAFIPGNGGTFQRRGTGTTP